MSAYSDQIDASRDRNSQLFKQVQRAVLKIAGYIVSTEPADTANHAARLDWARQIRYGSLGISEDYASRMMPMILENGTVAADPNNAQDSDIQWIVETNLNTFLSGGA